MADRDLLSKPKAARMVGGKANLERLVKDKLIRPVDQPNGREGFVELDLVRWQEERRRAPVEARVYSTAELRALDRGEQISATARA